MTRSAGHSSSFAWPPCVPRLPPFPLPSARLQASASLRSGSLVSPPRLSELLFVEQPWLLQPLTSRSGSRSRMHEGHLWCL